MEPEQRQAPPTHCAGCGDRLEAGPRNRNPRKWCSESCRVRTYSRRNAAKVKASSEAKRERIIAENEEKHRGAVCEHCGGETRWTALRVPRRFCSALCSRRAKYQRSLRDNPACISPGCDRPQHCRGLCSSHWSRKWNDEHPDAYWRSRAEYRARKRDATVEPVSRDAVLSRDDWRCGICGERIISAAEWPDPASPSIDHIVPLSKGGEHSMSNVQAAHYGCNSAKKATVSSERTVAT